jgi:tripartite-type tricarboxylate transporter receptor subunit TctC
VPNRPELPLLADAVPGYDSRGWFGFVAPAGTPQDVVRTLNEEINRAMRLPDVAQKMTAAGLIITTESAEFFGGLLKTDYEKYGKLVKSIGFAPQ